MVDSSPVTATQERFVRIYVGQEIRPAKLQTLAMKTALNKLAYHSYHMEQCLMNWKKYHLQYWLEALRAKYLGRGKPYGKSEFDKVLGEYDVIRPFQTIFTHETDENPGYYRYSLYHVCGGACRCLSRGESDPHQPRRRHLASVDEQYLLCGFRLAEYESPRRAGPSNSSLLSTSTHQLMGFTSP